MRSSALNLMWQPIVGGFVWTNDRLGIGKLVTHDGSVGEVEFFHSAARSERGRYPTADLRRGYLPLQTRVYHQRGGRWFLGRVAKRYVQGTTTASYLVKFPNYQPAELLESDLEVRCLLPLADPTEVLAAGAVEAQFLADRRAKVLDALAEARQVSRSLGGLLSASVQLLPHQVEIVRHVTEDPIQRYLLADEVGMGKTIEAAAIIRQALLDHQDDRVVVVTPGTLVRQWRRELAERFGLIGDQLRIVPFERINEIEPGEVDFLVVDEAHHLVARHGNGEEHDRWYARLTSLANASARLLLLSATPVLGDTGATLALLNLLDPDQYGLNDREAFELRLRARQDFGRLLLSLRSDAPAFLLRRSLATATSLVPDDPVIAEAAVSLEEALEGRDTTRVKELVASLRDHITETYRLNRRLLRTRRRDTEGWELAARQSLLTTDVDEDERVVDAVDALEEWRYRAVQSVSRSDQSMVADPASPSKSERAMLNRFASLFEALGRSVRDFVDEMDAQRGLIQGGRLPTFPEEAEIAERIRGLTTAPNVGMSRSDHAAAVIDLSLRSIKSYPPRWPKVVAFGSSTSLAREVATRITALRGLGVAYLVTAELSEDEVDHALGKFRDAGKPAVLICDRSGEEGLNLQFVDAVVHLDLPLDPLRVEQRIGRLDRIGRKASPIRHRLIIPTDDDHSPWDSWLALLRSGFGVFDETIADLQFALDAMLFEVRLTLFREGAIGVRKLASRIKDLVAAERKRLDEQYALDRLELGESEGHLLFARLDAAERTDQALAAGLNAWWQNVLHLEQTTHDDEPGVFRLRWTDDTLIPREPWEDSIQPILGQPLTFNRDVALRVLGTRLVRSGNPLVEVLPHFLRYDDRGTAFMTWRMDSSWDGADPWICFKLTYLVELDGEAIGGRLWDDLDAVRTSALQRRADMLFAPWVETHFIDPSLTPIEDPRWLGILSRPYEREVTTTGTRDFNLGSRPAALASLVDPQMLATWAASIREHAQELVRSSERFQVHLREAHRRAAEGLAVTTGRLERRQRALLNEGARDAHIAEEIAMGREIMGEVDRPNVRLDSVGLIVLSRSAPA